MEALESPEACAHTAHPCSKLASVAAEALLLARKLVSYNVGRLLQQEPKELKATLSHFRLSSLLKPEGRECVPTRHHLLVPHA